MQGQLDSILALDEQRRQASAPAAPSAIHPHHGGKGMKYVQAYRDIVNARRGAPACAVRFKRFF